MTTQPTQNSVVLYGSTTFLLAGNPENEIANIARKLMKLTPGGRRLNKDEATDLAVYAFMTDLNPFNKECYYMPGVGPTPGIAGYERKVLEYLASQGDPHPRIWPAYEPASTGEADFDPEQGDIAYKVKLYNSTDRQKWQQGILNLFLELKGALGADAWTAAQNFYGPEPCHEGIGVVRGKENFGTTDKWERHNRAKKRALSQAVRLLNPHVIIPDYSQVKDTNMDRIAVSIAKQIETEASADPVDEKELMRQLGFDDGEFYEPA